MAVVHIASAFQFFLSCYSNLPYVDRGSVRDLSILSQLLPNDGFSQLQRPLLQRLFSILSQLLQHLRYSSTISKSCFFQFFLSCYPVSRLGRYTYPNTRLLSILSQLLPVYDDEYYDDEDEELSILSQLLLVALQRAQDDLGDPLFQFFLSCYFTFSST